MAPNKKTPKYQFWWLFLWQNHYKLVVVLYVFSVMYIFVMGTLYGLKRPYFGPCWNGLDSDIEWGSRSDDGINFYVPPNCPKVSPSRWKNPLRTKRWNTKGEGTFHRAGAELTAELRSFPLYLKDIYDSSEAREQCPSATQHTPGPHSVLRGKKKLSQHSPPSCLGLFSFACSHDLNEGEVKSFTFTFNRWTWHL